MSRGAGGVLGSGYNLTEYSFLASGGLPGAGAYAFLVLSHCFLGECSCGMHGFGLRREPSVTRRKGGFQLLLGFVFP